MLNKNLRTRKTVANVKGMDIEFEEYYLINPETNEEIFDRDIEIENDLRLYDIYKKSVNLLTSKEIKEIRKKYEMNQKEFALALGLGEITIHRFENGSIQTEAVDSIIRLSEDAEIMYKFLVKNKSNFNDEDYVKFLDRVILLKKLKEHKLADFNVNELRELEFKTSNAYDIANQVIIKYNSRVEEFIKKYKDIYGTSEYITPLKLQKLLYYIQGIASKVYDKPAFNNNIYAWSYGPVVEDIYQIYKGKKPIVTMTDEVKLNEGLNKIVDIVIESYGQIESKKLIDLTHNETPWSNTEKDNIISFDLIKEYFQNIY